jgi:hypothetical protein
MPQNWHYSILLIISPSQLPHQKLSTAERQGEVKGMRKTKELILKELMTKILCPIVCLSHLTLCARLPCTFSPLFLQMV